MDANKRESEEVDFLSAPQRVQGLSHQFFSSFVPIRVHSRLVWFELRADSRSSQASIVMCFVETVRRQREHTRKCAGANCNHQQQADAKSTYRCGQNKRADAERSTDLPNKLLTGGRAPHAANRDTVLHHYSQRGRQQSHSGAGDEGRSDDPAEPMLECHHEKEKSQNMDNNSNHTRKSFADSMD